MATSPSLRMAMSGKPTLWRFGVIPRGSAINHVCGMKLHWNSGQAHSVDSLVGYSHVYRYRCRNGTGGRVRGGEGPRSFVSGAPLNQWFSICGSICGSQPLGVTCQIFTLRFAMVQNRSDEGTMEKLYGWQSPQQEELY